jgi:hypothetical protein
MLLTIKKPLVPVWYRTQFPRCSIPQPGHCITVARVEQQQRTDRFDVSNTVHSAGALLVGEQQLLTCCFFRGLNLILEIQSEKLATENFRFSLVILCLYFVLLYISICAHYTVYRLVALLFCLKVWRIWQYRRKWTAERMSHLNAGPPVCTAEDTPSVTHAVF